MRPATVAIAVLAAAAFVGACGGGSTDTDVAPKLKGAQAKDAALVQGRTLWISECQSCHGPKGLGAIGPRLAGVVTNSFPNIQNEINVVTNGVGSQMPAWGGKLSAAQIEAIVRYTREVL